MGSVDLEIYFYYLEEEVVLGRKYQSPFRDDGSDPALRFKIIDETVCWKDFGGIDMNPKIKGKRDGLAFIMQMENLGSRLAATRFYNENIKNAVKREKPFVVKRPKETNTTLKIRTVWHDFEWEYWNFINRDLLRIHKVFPNELYDSGFIQIKSEPKSPSFVYLFSAEKNSWKVYTPFDKENKFKSNNVRGVIEGWEQLPESGQNLIISKSTKDRLVHLTYLNASSINPFSENAYSSLIEKKEEIGQRFKNIYVCLDADETGIKQTKNIAAQTGWIPVVKPEEWKAIGMKDESDIIRNHGKEKLIEVYKQLKLPIR